MKDHKKLKKRLYATAFADRPHGGIQSSAAWQAAKVIEDQDKELEAAYRLIRDFVDSDDCWFDHHGGCQAHGYLSLQPGELCPHAEAKALLAGLEKS